MEYLVTSQEMRAYDTNTIEKIGVPSLVLMERAALATVSCVNEVITGLEDVLLHSGVKRDIRILCVCGTGNNGGDGLCVARLLREQDYLADAVIIGNREKLSKETAIQLSILEKYDVCVGNHVPDETYDIIVDALFGIGLSREITGEALEAIKAINNQSAYTIALDIPSGIDADTGKVWGDAVKADETVSIAFRKRGHYLYPGTLFCGKIRVADIGITKRSFDGKIPQMYTFLEEPSKLLPQRRADGNKGTFGKVLIVAGSDSMSGAALLCAESAYKTGAGMVKLVVPETIREVVQVKLPEALLQVYHTSTGLSDEEKDLFMENIRWADVIAVGPGLGVSKSGAKFLEAALLSEKPLLIDADGLNTLAASEDLWMKLQQRRYFTVLTPHMGELARLLHKAVAEVIEDETRSTMELADMSGCVVVGKSARTPVCANLQPIFLNTAGNDKMATAGSGDVLAGMIAALMAQESKTDIGYEQSTGTNTSEVLFQAVCKGVYLHAAVGDVAAKQAGKSGIMASDIIYALGFV